MSVARDASTRLWITGYLGGAFFFKSASAARRAFTFVLDSAGNMRSNALSSLVRDLLFQALASALTNAVISFSLAAIAAWPLL